MVGQGSINNLTGLQEFFMSKLFKKNKKSSKKSSTYSCKFYTWYWSSCRALTAVAGKASG